MKRISVIIVSWNTRELLKDCLTSILEQGGSLVQEIIVVDNASTDGSLEMVAEEFPAVTVIYSKENLGFARANNIGLKQATGSWLALINSDVVVHPECFQRLIQYLEANDKAGLVGPAVFGADGRLQPTCRRLPTIWSTRFPESRAGQYPFASARSFRPGAAPRGRGPGRRSRSS